MIIGLDLSLASTGIAMADTVDEITVLCRGSCPAGSLPFNRTVRSCGLAEIIMEEVLPEMPEHAFIEGYSFGRFDSSAAEFRGEIYRRLMVGGCLNIYEVPPSTLKQFVTGKGSSQKETVRLEAFKRWGVEYETNDEVDAYGLLRLGMCVVGLDEPTCEAQRKAVAKVIEIAKGEKKPRKKKAAKVQS